MMQHSTEISGRIVRLSGPMRLIRVEKKTGAVVARRPSSSPSRCGRTCPRGEEWASIHWTNLAILAVVAIMWKTIGIQRFLMVQLPIITVASSIGVWLFYVQHQFEHTYWQHSSGWDFHTAALRGSSYYDLPKILRWFTGNIGLHHIHHLCSRIPNYRLQECFNANPELQQVTRLTLRQSLAGISLTLWDEEQQKLVRFRSPQVAE